MAYAPAGSTTQTPSLQHQAGVTFYDRKGLTRLMANFYMLQVGTPKPLPMNSGKTIQMFRFSLPGSNTVPAAEGVIPNPVPQASNVITSTVEQYSDFMSSSALLNDTDINDTATQMIEDLSYRAALSADTIFRIEVDSNTSALVPTLGANLSAADFKAQTTLLKGLNVRTYADGNFMSIVHPYVTYDVISDNTAGGFIDASKYTRPDAVLNGELGKLGNCKIMESTNVGTNGAAAPSTLYNSYIFGAESMGQVDLAGRGPDKVVDPANERFKVNVIKGGASAADPTGEIGTYVSYRFVFAAKTLDASRIKIIQSDASLI